MDATTTTTQKSSSLKLLLAFKTSSTEILSWRHSKTQTLGYLKQPAKCGETGLHKLAQTPKDYVHRCPIRNANNEYKLYMRSHKMVGGRPNVRTHVWLPNIFGYSRAAGYNVKTYVNDMQVRSLSKKKNNGIQRMPRTGALSCIIKIGG
jgi:hypothetical protein